MRNSVLFSLVAVLLLTSCAKTRIKEHKEWGKYYENYGITNAGFMLMDNNHESVHYYNKEYCLKRYLPASTFKIFNSLVALEADIAPSDEMIIKWDSVVRRPEWDKDMNMREAFKVSCVPFYQELARRIGRDRMQHYLDTVKYGNAKMGAKVDNFWLDNSLKISADEQVGFLKRLYFNELPFSERSQRIVRSMMLNEDSTGYKLYYKTGTGIVGDSTIYWIVGFAERIEDVVELKGSMNKSNVRIYPYFFAQNFVRATNDTTRDWNTTRLAVLHEVLKAYGAIPGSPGNNK